MKHFSLMLVMVLFVMSTALAQRTVTGTVLLDGDGEAIGANVIVEGDEGVGTVTEFDGTFSLDVPETAKALEISYTGYATQIVSIDGVSTLNITLVEGEVLSTVTVTTQYFAKDRTELTGTVSKVGSEKIERVPMATFDNILQGQVSGLQISGGTGQPGVAAGKIQLRGASSILGSSQPIFFLDGVQIDAGLLSNINPNDIEEVTVLKDAASIALYGANGANGVILVTTKNGKLGVDQPTKITYRTQFGVTTPTQSRFNVMNSSEKLAYELYLGQAGQANAQSAPGFLYGDESSSEYNLETYDSLANINTDWTDVFFRNGLMNQHDLSIQGGSKKTAFYLSASYLYQEGQAFTSSDLRRGSSRFNVTHKANDRLTLGSNTQIGYSRRNFIQGEGAVNLRNPFAAAYLNNPYETPFLEDGSYNFDIANAINVVEATERSTRERDELKILGNVFAELEIIKGLKAKTSWGMDYTEQTRSNWTDPESQTGINSSQGNAGSYGESYFRQPKWIGTTTVNYTKLFGEKQEHKIFALVGTELARELFRSFSYTGYGLDINLPNTGAGIPDAFGQQDEALGGIVDLANAGDIDGLQTALNDLIGVTPAVGGSRSVNARASYFGSMDYIYQGKYILTGSLRRDGISTFGANNRWGTFWAIGTAWNASDEKFLEDVSWLEYLKIGLSYGSNGNSTGIDDFESRATYGVGSYGSNNIYAQSNLGRPDLKWEVQKQLNLGIEFAFLEGRLDGSFDLYNNVTEDLFLEQNLPLSSGGGFSSIVVNSGKMRNRGVELNLNATLIQKGGLFLGVNGNIGYNDNEILSLGGQDEFEFGTTIAQEGLAYNTHFITGWAGVDPATGQPLYYDLNGNVTENYGGEAFNNTIYGTPEPPVIGGFGTTLSYKGFSLLTTFSFVAGNTLFNNQSFFQENHNFSQYNQYTTANNIWKNPGDITEIQGAQTVNGNITAREFTSKDIEPGDFLRFRNLTISYTVPSKTFGKVLSGITIFAQGQNLFTVTKFTGFDPEIDDNIAQYEYPAPRVFTGGIEINF